MAPTAMMNEKIEMVANTVGIRPLSPNDLQELSNEMHLCPR